MINQDFRNDSLHVILTNNIHKNLPDKSRAVKIARCCKVIRDRTQDKEMYDTCRIIIKATQDGDYAGVIKTAEMTETGYRAMHIKELFNPEPAPKHPECKGFYITTVDGREFDCGYNTSLDCSDCKYNDSKHGRKNPAAKCNAL